MDLLNLYIILSSLSTLISTTDCSDLNVISLDHVLGHDTPFHVNAGSEPFSYEIIEASSTRGFWLAMGKYKSMEQMGTVVISPYSFNEKSEVTVDKIPPHTYFGEAAVIDIRDKVAKNSLYELTVQDVEDWLKTNKGFSNNSIVLINTGWEIGRYPDTKKYIGDDRGFPEKDVFPGVGLDAMKAMLEYEKKKGINIFGFGIDAPLLDRGGALSLSAAEAASVDKYLIKNLKDLYKLPSKGARLMVLPMKIKNGTGAPARVLAVLP